MADDIIARLNEVWECATHPWQRNAINDAKAEIERLRAERDAIDALACSVDRPDDAVDYWVTGYADAMQKVKALLHPEEARRER